MNGFVFLFLFATVALIQGKNTTDQYKDGKPFLKALSCFNAPRDDNGVENLIKPSKRVDIQVSPFCSLDMGTGAIDRGTDDKIRFFNPTAECRVGTPLHPTTRVASRTQVKVYTCREPSADVLSCGDGASSRALYLPYNEDKNTYMILDADRAQWFFTTQLSGCDIFIATNTAQPKKPLVVHANRNVCPRNHLANFRVKGEATDEIVPGFAAGYELKIRVHIQRESTAELTAYWSAYRSAHNNIPLVTYRTERPAQMFNFFGQYQGETRGWRFFLKGQSNGAITKVKWTA